MNLQQKTELASELIANAERQRKDAEATSAHYIGLANAALKPSTPTPRTDEARRIDNGDTHPLLDEMEQMERELAAERVRAKLWEDKCHELIAPHYILDPCLRAHRFREALQFHPVLNNNPTPFWKKYGGPNDT